MEIKKVFHIFAACFMAVLFVKAVDFTSIANAAPFKPVDFVTEANPMPEFPGGVEEFEKFINDNITFPTDPTALKDYKDAKIDLRLIIMSDGSVGPFTPFLPAGRPYLKINFENILKKCPRFKPGKVNGKPVNVRITIPITINPLEE